MRQGSCRKQPPSRALALTILSVLVIVGAILRTVAITKTALWGDEALTLIIKNWGARDLMLSPVDPTPGLYYLLHLAFVADGSGLGAVRAISAIAGTLTIIAGYYLGLATLGRRAGIILAALIALSPAMIDYSQEARCYAVLILVFAIAAIGLTIWGNSLDQAKARAFGLILFTIGSVLAFYTHVISIFWIGPATLIGSTSTFRSGNIRSRTLWLTTLVAMTFTSLAEVRRSVWRMRLGGGFDWLTQTSPQEAVATLGSVWLPVGVDSHPEPSAGFDSLAALMIGTLALLAWRSWRQRENLKRILASRPATLWVMAVLLAAPVLMWLFGFAVTPIFMQRTVLPFALGFFMLIALLDAAGERWLAPMIVAGSLMSLAAGGTVRAKPDWGGVAKELGLQVKPGDAILMCATWEYPALRNALPARLPAPVLVVNGKGHLVEFKDRAGQENHWARVYFDAIQEDQFAKILGRPVRTPPPASLRGYRHMWWVQSSCTEEEIMALSANADWSAQWRLFRSWKLPHYAPIGLWVNKPPPQDFTPDASSIHTS